MAERKRPVRILASPLSAKGNPYNDLLRHALTSQHSVIVQGWRPVTSALRCDIWHVHWPEARLGSRHTLVALAGLLAVLTGTSVAKLAGLRVVWTVHNLRPHERRHPILEKLFYTLFPRSVDAFIFLSRSTFQAARSELPIHRPDRCWIIPHGHYRAVFPGSLPDRQEARRRLDLPQNVFLSLFFGRIRPYKNLPRLVECFRHAADDGERLAIIGKPNERQVLDAIGAAADDDPRIDLRPDFVPDEQLLLWVLASDVVILPYREIANSGSALFALSANRPVISCSKGAMTELSEQVGDHWVFLYEGELTARDLRRGLDWARELPAESPNLQASSWPNIADRTMSVYAKILDIAGDARGG